MNLWIATISALLLVPPLRLAAETPRPNVILMVADDLGYNDLGCYGATKVATPRTDSLAREGVRFTDAHSCSRICMPSRYTILTGRYAFRLNRSMDYACNFDPGQVLLPAALLSAVQRAEGKLLLLVAEGESVPGPVLQIGNTNGRYWFVIGAKAFLNEWSKAGPAHHCAIGTGHVGETIKKIGALLKIETRAIC